MSEQVTRRTFLRGAAAVGVLLPGAAFAQAKKPAPAKSAPAAEAIPAGVKADPAAKRGGTLRYAVHNAPAHFDVHQSGTVAKRDAAPLVLIVDDSLDTRQMYETYLEYCGFRVIEAANGEQAVVQATELHPDVRLVHDADLLGHRDLDGAFAALAQRIAVRLHLLAACIAARQRPALVAEVLVEQRAREAEGARIHRLTQKLGDLGHFGGGSGPLHRRLAHHVMPKGG